SSSWEASTPESTTATVMPEPVEYDQTRWGSSHSSGSIGAAPSSGGGWATPAVPATSAASAASAASADPAVPVASVSAGANSTAATATAATVRDRAGTGTSRFSQTSTPAAAIRLLRAASHP